MSMGEGRGTALLSDTLPNCARVCVWVQGTALSSTGKLQRKFDNTAESQEPTDNLAVSGQGGSPILHEQFARAHTEGIPQRILSPAKAVEGEARSCN